MDLTSFIVNTAVVPDLIDGKSLTPSSNSNAEAPSLLINVSLTVGQFFSPWKSPTSQQPGKSRKQKQAITVVLYQD